MRSRKRGRATILKILRGYVNFERFASGIGERTVETNFYALDEELRKLRELGTQEENPRAAVNFEDAANRLALVIDDLKKRSYDPADYVRDRTRIYRDSWINPLIDELLSKEK